MTTSESADTVRLFITIGGESRKPSGDLTLERLTATFELVTPAFAGGPELGGTTDGLRVPAIKSMIRFWWRAMQASVDVPSLRSAEAELFGSSDGRVGQRLSIVPGSCGRHESDGVGTAIDRHDQTYTYMAYGPVTWIRERKQPELVTPRIRVGHKLPVTFRIQGKVPGANREHLVKALWLLSAFGGYGGRSRRGWGSLAVRGLEHEWQAVGLADPHGHTSPALLKQGLETGLAACLGPKANGPSASALKYTAFSSESRVAIGPRAHVDWKSALDAASKTYVDYRRMLGARQGHEAVTGPDFDLRDRWRRTAAPTNADTCPRGSAFGLPHFAKYDVRVGVGHDLDGRRASPLFVKVLRSGENGGAIPLFLWLPAQFLGPQQIHARVPGSAAAEVRYVGEQPIRDFFDGALIPQGSRGNVAWKSLTSLGWTEVSW